MVAALKNTPLPNTGCDGDANSNLYYYTFAASAISTRIELQELQAGTELQEIAIIADALGAGVTLSLGELFASTADGTTSATSLKAATAANTANLRINGDFHPKLLTVPMTPTITVAGAAATGKISVLVKTRYVGNGY